MEQVECVSMCVPVCVPMRVPVCEPMLARSQKLVRWCALTCKDRVERAWRYGVARPARGHAGAGRWSEGLFGGSARRRCHTDLRRPPAPAAAWLVRDESPRGHFCPTRPGRELHVHEARVAVQIAKSFQLPRILLRTHIGHREMCGSRVAGGKPYGYMDKDIHIVHIYLYISVISA